jgi:hypothetical protein
MFLCLMGNFVSGGWGFLKHHDEVQNKLGKIGVIITA